MTAPNAPVSSEGETPRHPIARKWLRGDVDAGGCIAELERELAESQQVADDAGKFIFAVVAEFAQYEGFDTGDRTVQLANIRKALRELAALRSRCGQLMDDVERESGLSISQTDWDVGVLEIVKEMKRPPTAARTELPEEPPDELEYFDRQIDSMWFMLRKDKKPAQADAAEWAKHTRNCYLRLKRNRDALHARCVELQKCFEEVTAHRDRMARIANGLNSEKTAAEARCEELAVELEAEKVESINHWTREVEFKLKAEAAERQLAEANEWRSSVLNAIKKIAEYHSGEWGGDKEGWGFCYELISWAAREIPNLRAQADALRRDAERLKSACALLTACEIVLRTAGFNGTAKPIAVFLAGQPIDAALAAPSDSGRREEA